MALTLFPNRDSKTTPALPMTASNSNSGISVKTMRCRRVSVMKELPRSVCRYRSPLALVMHSQSIAPALAVKRAGVNSQHNGSLLDCGRIRQHATDMFCFELFDRHRGADDQGFLQWRRADLRGKVRQADLGSRGKYHSTFNGVAKLSHVSRPGMPL